MTTDAFIGALKRMIATRGMCHHIYSDNGTNFVGANSELQQLRKLFLSEQHQQETTKFCQDNNITWHFQPPSSPHFGGLYEAAVKSSKHHMLRVIGNASLTFEELNTVIKQVEAVLNSRPLTPLSSSPDDLNALTPGHFLIGRPLTTIIEPNTTNENLSTVRRWRLVQQLQQHFWSRWSKEYLCELQHRRKWTTATKSVSPGELVLLKDENVPPLKWKMGRVIAIYPGDDGHTRVAMIKTSTGILKRSISKLCPLPVNDDNLKDGILQGGEDV